MSKLIFNKYNKNLFKFRYYSTSKNTDDLFEIKKDEKKYNWINELNGDSDSNRKTNKRLNKSVIDTLSFQKKQSSKNNEWESVSNKIKNKTLSEINRAQKSVLLDEHEQWQRTIIESLEKHQEDGKDLKRIDKLLTIKNALRPDLVDHEYYHNPQHIDELMSEERKREWRALKVHRVDAPKILNRIREHLGRGEKLPIELVKKAEQILKKPIFDELKQNGLLHEEYMDNLIMPEVEGREAMVDDEPKDDAPSIIHPEDLNNKLKDSTEDWFALEDNSINSPKKNCEFCFCKGVMPELHPMNVHLLLHFMSPGGRIMSRRHTGLCAKWQRKVSRTIRRAKNLGIFSYNKSKYYINFPFESPATTEYLNQKYQNLIPVLVDEEDAYKTVSEDEVQHSDEEVFSDEDEQRFKAENTNDVFSKIEQDFDRGRGMDGSDNEGLTGEEDEEDELLGGREEEEEEIGEDEEENQQNPDEEEDIGEGQEIIKDVDIYKKIHRRRSSKELDLRRSNNYDVITDKLQK